MNKVLFATMFTALSFYAAAQTGGAMHGVSIGGTADAPTIVNNSGKPVIGYVVHQIGVARNQVLLFQDLLTKDNPGIQPGESRAYKQMLSVRPASNVITAAKEVVLTGVLFGDGQWIGSDEGLRAKYKHRLEMLKAFGNGQTNENSPDVIESATHRTAAGMVEGVRQRAGEGEAQKALGRAANVPELWEEK